MFLWMTKTRLRTALTLLAFISVPSLVVGLFADNVNYGYAWFVMYPGVALTLVLARMADVREKNRISS